MAGIGGWARSTPDAAALISAPQRLLDFETLDRRQRSLAAVLHREGLHRGDRIAIFCRNRAEVVEVATGALRAGIVPVPINPLLTKPEIGYVLEDCHARWLFSDRFIELLPPLDRLVIFGDAYERLLDQGDGAELADHTLTRPMHYTSGTTGLPKGVYVAPAPEDEAARRSEDFRRLWSLDPDELHLVCSPLAHSAPLRFATRTLEAGGAVVVQERFDPESTLAAIDMYGITSTFMVPTHLERILGLGPRKIGRFDLSSIRMLAHAGAPIREEVKRAALDLFPPGSVWEFYGSTEGQATRISPEEWERKPGSVGQGYPGSRIYVMSESFETVPTGEVGEVWVLDPNVESFEYWGDAEKTRGAWRDGAFYVGDLGHVDEDGYLFLVGRKDDTIITGGVNVYPAEVEAVLHTHPDVAEVIVYGAPSNEWGEEVRAKIVGAPGRIVDVEGVEAWARERLAPYKIPKQMEVVDELRSTSTGKRKRPSS